MSIYFKYGFRALFLLGLLLLLCVPLFIYPHMLFPFIAARTFFFRAVVDVLIVFCCLYRLQSSSREWGDSWIVRSLLLLWVGALISTCFSIDVNNSLFGNYERMDGLDQLTHYLFYFLILTYCLANQREWYYWIYASLAIALAVVAFELKYADGVERLNSLFSNPVYLAIYLFFQCFWVAYLMLHTQNKWLRCGLTMVAGVFLYALFRSGTRGVVLSIVVAILVTGVFLIATRERRLKHPWLYSLSFIGLTGLIVAPLCYFLFSYWNTLGWHVLDSQPLAKRLNVWWIALDGAKHAPWLGWGMSNFGYVFNFYYLPSLYAAELWFDKAHNAFLEWLVSGGLIGLLTYVGVWGSTVYSINSARGKAVFSRIERALLLGGLSGYLTYILFTVDSIFSYMCFLTFLAFIHVRVRQPLAINWIWLKKIQSKTPIRYGFIIPALSFCCVFYIIRIITPGFLAAEDITMSLHARDGESSYQRAHQALERSSNDFGHQEALEHLFRLVVILASKENISQQKKEYYIQQTIADGKDYLSRHNQNARMHFCFGVFAVLVNEDELADKELAMAHRLSPKRQLFLMQRGAIALKRNDTYLALELFKKAYRLDKSYQLPRQYYNEIVADMGVQERLS